MKLGWLMLAVCSATLASAADDPVRPQGTAVTVNGEAIRWQDVLATQERAVQDRPTDRQVEALLHAKTLRLLVNRQLLLNRLERENAVASEADVTLALQRWKAQTEQQGEKWSDLLRREALDEEGAKRRLRWQLTWSMFLTRYVTDQNLERYFEQHRRDFDGTKMRVAQILLTIPAPRDPGAQQAAVKKAGEIRDEILSQKLDFAAAARKYSTAPTAQDGGDLGWIERHQPMPESFSRAAFALDAGDLSPPVVTGFGVHLILCQEIMPGTKGWRDVREDLIPAVADYLLQWYADRERPQAKIIWGEIPPDVRDWLRLLGEPLDSTPSPGSP